MKKIITILFLLTAVSWLSGCVYMTKRECASADWHAIGFEKGARGASESGFKHKRADCNVYGYEADRTAYTSGYEKGLMEYCTYDNGFSYGKKGQGLSTQCTEREHLVFRLGVVDGAKIYCSYDLGLKDGKRGRDIPELCESKEHTDYFAGYEKGNVYYTKAKLDRIERDQLLNDITEKVSALSTQNMASEYYLSSGKLSPGDQRKLRKQIVSNKKQLRYLERAKILH